MLRCLDQVVLDLGRPWWR